MRKIAGISAAYLEVQVAAGAIGGPALRLLGRRAHARPTTRRTCSPTRPRVLARAGALGVPRIHFGVGTANLLGLDGRGRRRRRRASTGGRRSATAIGQVGDRAVQGNLDPTLVFAPAEVMTAARRRDHRGRPRRPRARVQPRARRAAEHRPRPAQAADRVRAVLSALSLALRPLPRGHGVLSRGCGRPGLRFGSPASGCGGLLGRRPGGRLPGGRLPGRRLLGRRLPGARWRGAAPGPSRCRAARPPGSPGPGPGRRAWTRRSP